jgi:hypothetical protein
VTSPPIEALGAAVGFPTGGDGRGWRGGASEVGEEPTTRGGRGGEEPHGRRKKTPVVGGDRTGGQGGAKEEAVHGWGAHDALIARRVA